VGVCDVPSYCKMKTLSIGMHTLLERGGACMEDVPSAKNGRVIFVTAPHLT
jgi:hypothetical protein